MRRGASPRTALGLTALVIAAGCTLAPKGFDRVDDLSPLVRARALTLGDEWPERVVVPELIRHLEDPDPVVRLTAHNELCRRTGRDFGFRPWHDESSRAQAVARWESWWNGEGATAPPSPEVEPAPRAVPNAVQGASG